MHQNRGIVYSIPLSLSLSKSKVWRMKTESRLWFASLESSEICMATNPGKRSSPYVRRSSCFSFLHAFTVHNLASSAYVSIFPYVTIILYVLLHTCRLERCVTLFLRHANVRREGGIPSRWRTRISLFTCSLVLARFLSLRSQSPLRQLFRERPLRGWNKVYMIWGPRTRVKRFSIRFGISWVVSIFFLKDRFRF